MALGPAAFISCSRNLGILPKWQAGVYYLTKWKELSDGAETGMVLNLQPNVDRRSFWIEHSLCLTQKSEVSPDLS